MENEKSSPAAWVVGVVVVAAIIALLVFAVGEPGRTRSELVTAASAARVL
jgi:hypothetical protein